MCEFFKTFQEEKFTESVKKVPFNFIFFIVDISEQSSLLEGGDFVRSSTREQKKVVVCFRHKKPPKQKNNVAKLIQSNTQELCIVK